METVFLKEAQPCNRFNDDFLKIPSLLDPALKVEAAPAALAEAWYSRDEDCL
jgi:hypothetical protein